MNNTKETLENGGAHSGEGAEQLNGAVLAVRKPISAAKLAANRRNGQKSRGPKTVQGKSISRWNSTKHGVLSRRLLVLSDDDRQTYTLLLENLRRDLNPQGTLEEILIEKIAMAYWRLHVAYGYEASFARSRSEFITIMDRMGRYANTIHRQLLQAMNELERLQRRRNGETVPAPISVEVNVNQVEDEFRGRSDEPQIGAPVLGSVSPPLPGRLISSGEGLNGAHPPVSIASDVDATFCQTNPSSRDGENTGESDDQADDGENSVS